MTLHAPCLLGSFGEPGRLLPGTGQLSPPATLARSHAAARATALGADGTTLAEHPADIARFAGTGRRLVVEGSRTNGVRNPRAEGGTNGVIGSGGAYPTNWSHSLKAGITAERIGVVTVNGVTCLRLRLSGTATATGANSIYADTSTGIAAANAQAWTMSCFARLQASAGTVPALQLRPVTRTSTGTQLTVLGGVDEVVTGSLARFSRGFTIADATAGAIQPMLAFNVTSGIAYDATFDIGWPQMEQATFASSAILPLTGAPAAATRGADLPTATLATLGLPANRAATLLLTAIVPQAAPAGINQNIIQLDDGGSTNRVVLRNEAGGSLVKLYRVTAGAGSAGQTVGTLAPGTVFRLGLALDGAGRSAASFNGAAAVAETGGPTTALTRLALGFSGAGSEALFGEVGTLRVLPFALSDAALAGAVAALP
jgi:hypothetical protein